MPRVSTRDADRDNVEPPEGLRSGCCCGGGCGWLRAAGSSSAPRCFSVLAAPAADLSCHNAVLLVAAAPPLVAFRSSFVGGFFFCRAAAALISSHPCQLLRARRLPQSTRTHSLGMINCSFGNRRHGQRGVLRWPPALCAARCVAALQSELVHDPLARLLDPRRLRLRSRDGRPVPLQ